MTFNIDSFVIAKFSTFLLMWSHGFAHVCLWGQNITDGSICDH